MRFLRKRIDFVNIFPSCRIPLRTFPVDPTGSNFPGRPPVCINYLLSSLSCVIADTHAQSTARAHLRKRMRARFPHISRYINLVKWAMHMLTPPESFRRIANCGGGVQYLLGITRSFYAYICISYAQRGRTDAERNVDHRLREAGYKHLLFTIGLYGLWCVHVLV